MQFVWQNGSFLCDKIVKPVNAFYSGRNEYETIHESRCTHNYNLFCGNMVHFIWQNVITISSFIINDWWWRSTHILHEICHTSCNLFRNFEKQINRRRLLSLIILIIIDGINMGPCILFHKLQSNKLFGNMVHFCVTKLSYLVWRKHHAFYPVMNMKPI